jgi:hypothetical protein
MLKLEMNLDYPKSGSATEFTRCFVHFLVLLGSKVRPVEDTNCLEI